MGMWSGRAALVEVEAAAGRPSSIFANSPVHLLCWLACLLACCGGQPKLRQLSGAL